MRRLCLALEISKMTALPIKPDVSSPARARSIPSYTANPASVVAPPLSVTIVDSVVSGPQVAFAIIGAITIQMINLRRLLIVEHFPDDAVRVIGDAINCGLEITLCGYRE